ncbi:MAG: Gfo/Idh/MocA family oxidoreductase [Bacteroidota bacterium]
MKWGLIGYGRIAQKFEKSIAASPHSEIVAVASRSKYENIPSEYARYDTYAGLVEDAEVEIVYVCTPHNFHKEHSLLALRGGKHVLCEKPMGISTTEVDEMYSVARGENRFLMEAVWSRFLPGYEKAMSIVHSGQIGAPLYVDASFGFAMDVTNPKPRLLQKNLAGGAIWDVGIYPISLTQDVFGLSPSHCQTLGACLDTGVESRALIQLKYGAGRLAKLSCAFDLRLPNQATIIGTSGRIIMDDFWKCERFRTIIEGETTEYHEPMVATGLYHEIIACEKYISQGYLESDRMGYDHSMDLAKTMDLAIQQARES